MLHALVRPRHARRAPVAAALAVTALLAVGACADDVEPTAPEESRSPTALDEPDATADPGAEPDADVGADSDADTDADADAGQSTDDLARPASWPAELDWTPVEGVVEDFTTIPDGSFRLVVTVPVDGSAPAPQKLVSGWADELRAAAHSVETSDTWAGGAGESVVTAQHPQRVIETRVSRGAPDEPLRVQVLLTPLG